MDAIKELRNILYVGRRRRNEVGSDVIFVLTAVQLLRWWTVDDGMCC